MLDRVTLKEKLLGTEYFIENSFLEKYLKLVCHKYYRKHVLYKHHILQRKYYHLIKKRVDDSKDNIIELPFDKHCLAHWYLINCTIGELRRANIRAIHQMITQTKKMESLNEKIIKQLAKYAMLATEDKESSYWTSKEIKILKTYYPLYGSKECLKYLSKRKYTYNIKAAAKRFGIKSKNAYPAWTKNEDEILAKYYPVGGYKLCEQYLNRTRTNIQARANTLGIVGVGWSKIKKLWTKDEEEILYKYYVDFGAKYCEQFLPGKSYNSIKGHANKMGLTRKGIKENNVNN